MGMFDYVRCEMPLPETPGAVFNRLFQTKDTPDQSMTVYTITADGRLSWRPYRIVEVPKAERPYPNDDGLMGMMGCIRRVEEQPETIDDFHGDVDFYESHGNGGWVEYRARFTNGTCEKITLLEFSPAPQAQEPTP